MDVGCYLDRIGFKRSVEPTADVLRHLHRTHLFSVPFENLDIPLGRSIVLNLRSLYEKVVVHGRGGFCYELNGLFGSLLREVGFEVDVLSGRVFSDGEFGPEFDHMLLFLAADGPMIADVGFGDSFVEPVRLGREVRDIDGRAYRVTENTDGWVLERLVETSWVPQYAFTLEPRELCDFEEMCHFQQTSPDSVFRRKSICSMATPTGRITLSNDRLIITHGGHRHEQEIEDVERYRSLLGEHYGIRLDADADIRALLRPEGKR